MYNYNFRVTIFFFFFVLVYIAIKFVNKLFSTRFSIPINYYNISKHPFCIYKSRTAGSDPIHLYLHYVTKRIFPLFYLHCKFLNWWTRCKCSKNSLHVNIIAVVFNRARKTKKNNRTIFLEKYDNYYTDFRCSVTIPKKIVFILTSH